MCKVSWFAIKICHALKFLKGKGISPQGICLKVLYLREYLLRTRELGKELEGNLNEVLKKQAYWIYCLVYFWIANLPPSELPHCQIREWNRVDEEIRSQSGFSLKPKGAKGVELGLLSKSTCRKADLWPPLAAERIQLQHGPGAHLVWQPPRPHATAS